jgi:predicted nucleotidyltransferase
VRDMRFAAVLGLLIAGPILSIRGAVPAGSRLTVLLDFEGRETSVALNKLQRELQSILGSTGFTLDLQLKKQVPPRTEFSELVVFKMKGHCSAGPFPIAALSDERGALAMTYSSDGELLPFGEVECDRVRTALERVFGRNAVSLHQSEYSIALARVMAHEIYHMLGNSKEHTKEGLTKHSLSSRDLYQGRLLLPSLAQERISEKASPTEESALR